MLIFTPDETLLLFPRKLAYGLGVGPGLRARTWRMSAWHGLTVPPGEGTRWSNMWSPDGPGQAVVVEDWPRASVSVVGPDHRDPALRGEARQHSEGKEGLGTKGLTGK